jgi:hypothetical protein
MYSHPLSFIVPSHLMIPVADGKLDIVAAFTPHPHPQDSLTWLHFIGSNQLP